MDTVIVILLWFCALGCGLIAGLYFAFSTFIMRALGRIDAPSGIAAMNSINAVILRSLFIPLFFGTTLAAAVLAIAALIDLAEPSSKWMLAGGVIYVVGMFVLTMVFNVPLNNELAATDPARTEVTPVWSRYLQRWTQWNHVRTVCSTVASGMFIAAIASF